MKFRWKKQTKKIKEIIRTENRDSEQMVEQMVRKNQTIYCEVKQEQIGQVIYKWWNKDKLEQEFPVWEGCFDYLFYNYIVKKQEFPEGYNIFNTTIYKEFPYRWQAKRWVEDQWVKFKNENNRGIIKIWSVA